MTCLAPVNKRYNLVSFNCLDFKEHIFPHSLNNEQSGEQNNFPTDIPSNSVFCYG